MYARLQNIVVARTSGSALQPACAQANSTAVGVALVEPGFGLCRNLNRQTAN
jgi:hypothetical protein